jgi:hypothetical protein
MPTFQIAIVAGVTALALAFEHYLARFTNPGPLPGREWGWPRLVAYTLGVIGIALPFTVFLVWRGAWVEAAALWAAIVSGGVATGLCYGFDLWIETRRELHDAREREALERQQNSDYRGNDGPAQ